jgi:hypothetical protein
VPVGVKAVYASLEEETALREVTSRKSALGGRSQINVGEYPRMTYVLSVATHRNLDLAATLQSELANVVRLCLLGPGHSASQELASACAIVPKFWRPFANHRCGSVAGSISFRCVAALPD